MTAIRFVFFFNDTATTEIYTLSLHDALPISEYTYFSHMDEEIRRTVLDKFFSYEVPALIVTRGLTVNEDVIERSEEHTSELQSRQYLVCRLLLENKKRRLSGSSRSPAYK